MKLSTTFQYAVGRVVGELYVERVEGVVETEALSLPSEG
jgi:hypothetical protein